MPKKNDLTAIKLASKNTLQQEDVQTVLPDSTPTTKGKVGRKPKPISEKESGTLALKLTLQELENLREKAGGLPLSTFLKHYLRTQTNLFD